MGGAEDSLQLLLRANDDKVDHVAQVLKLIVDPSRNALQVLDQRCIKWSIGNLECRGRWRSWGDRRCWSRSRYAWRGGHLRSLDPKLSRKPGLCGRSQLGLDLSGNRCRRELKFNCYISVAG